MSVLRQVSAAVARGDGWAGLGVQAAPRPVGFSLPGSRSSPRFGLLPQLKSSELRSLQPVEVARGRGLPCGLRSDSTGSPLAVASPQPRPGLDKKLCSTPREGRHGSAGLIYIYVGIYVHTVSTVRAAGRASAQDEAGVRGLAGRHSRARRARVLRETGQQVPSWTELGGSVRRKRP